MHACLTLSCRSCAKGANSFLSLSSARVTCFSAMEACSCAAAVAEVDTALRRFTSACSSAGWAILDGLFTLPPQNKGTPTALYLNPCPQRGLGPLVQAANPGLATTN